MQQLPCRRFEHQQHALGAGELGRFVDQELVQFGLGPAHFVQPQPGVDQPLERLAQVHLAGEVGFAPLSRTCARARVRATRGRSRGSLGAC